MTLPRIPRLLAPLALGCSLAALAGTNAPVRPPEFAWRAALQAPADAPLVRVELPAAALGALQGRDYQDIRVFDQQGQALPLAMLPAPSHTATETAGTTVQALPMHQTGSQGERMTARVEVRNSRNDGSNGTNITNGSLQQLQVQWTSAPDPATGNAWQAALFDLRSVKGSIAALDVSLSLPDNTPVNVLASASSTLQQWQSLPTTGPLYHFAGPGAPHNTRLQFSSTVPLHDQFVLLQWPAEAGVQVQAVRPQLVAAAPEQPLLELGLPAGEPAPNGKGLEWALPPGAPVQSVQWRLSAANQLRTFHLQGRRASTTAGNPSAPWESLGTVVVYHLVQGGLARQNGPQPLPPGAWKALRLSDWPADTSPAPGSLQASLQLQPVRLAFLANGQAPYTLAVGRADTPSAALPLSTLTAAAATAPEAWPLATLSTAETTPTPAGQAQGLGERWRDFFSGTQLRIATLWLVLALAVVALAGAAFKLLRASKDGPGPAP